MWADRFSREDAINSAARSHCLNMTAVFYCIKGFSDVGWNRVLVGHGGCWLGVEGVVLFSKKTTQEDDLVRAIVHKYILFLSTEEIKKSNRSVMRYETDLAEETPHLFVL